MRGRDGVVYNLPPPHDRYIINLLITLIRFAVHYNISKMKSGGAHVREREKKRVR